MSEDGIQRQQLEWAQFCDQAAAWLDDKGQITEQTQAWDALVGERLAQATSATLRLHQASVGKRWYAASPRTGRALALAAFSSEPGMMVLAKLKAEIQVSLVHHPLIDLLSKQWARAREPHSRILESVAMMRDSLCIIQATCERVEVVKPSKRCVFKRSAIWKGLLHLPPTPRSPCIQTVNSATFIV